MDTPRTSSASDGVNSGRGAASAVASSPTSDTGAVDLSFLHGVTVDESVIDPALAALSAPTTAAQTLEVVPVASGSRDSAMHAPGDGTRKSPAVTSEPAFSPPLSGIAGFAPHPLPSIRVDPTTPSISAPPAKRRRSTASSASPVSVSPSLPPTSTSTSAASASTSTAAPTPTAPARIDRKERNRLAAQRSRDKKAKEMKDMWLEVEKLKCENEQLKRERLGLQRRVGELEEENGRLREQQTGRGGS